MRAPHAVAAVLLTASLALAGCGAGDDGARATKGVPDAAERGGSAAETVTGGAGPGYAADGQAGGAKPGAAAPGRAGQRTAAPQQHVVRTAELSVEVADATRALAEARTAAEAAGGHAANETTERVDDSHVTSQIVLRVPQSSYDAVLKELAGAGKLLSRKAEAKDVTEEVVDVESRIATQRASVDRVRKLMERATGLSDVVALEGQLSSRQADLESLLAQQASLKDRTTMATITLRLSEPEEHREEREEDPGVLDALGGGWDSLVTAARWTVIVLAAVAPWAAVLLLAWAAWRWLVRPRLPRRPAAGPVEARSPEGE
ncbi:DUF4349 domain-containing protein [Streptomyces sp. SP18CS02]|uniref:DUF4349 domain-containing protein n=1 Tax=Streptomyces sp. SP18CS02 TaxID=3002531 RepID=UPI002E75EBFC|nr:DUF4349 domain-containing protein [Streptomyces sp. SP18CS02]MEE1756527.1 DUF4349 domain-containing protein [Streptomyces sp. SP18CS02]